MVQETAKKSRVNPLLLILLTIFIDLVGFGLIIPVLPIYARQLHADDQTVGLLMASYSLMQLIFTPYLGRLSDKMGRRPILIVSLIASSIGYTLWGVSTSLLMLFLARLVAGAASANISVAQAYVTDVTTPETRAKGMGLVGAAFGLGFVLGPAIGSFFLQTSVYQWWGLLLRGSAFSISFLRCGSCPSPSDGHKIRVRRLAWTLRSIGQLCEIQT